MLHAVRNLLAVVVATCVVAAAAVAAPVNRFEPAIDAHGTKLQLNGAGTRFKAIFRVYDMALYTTKKVATPEELLGLPGPKRLQFVALRELPGDDLGRLFLRGMSDNSPEQQVRKHVTATTRFIEIFSGRAKLVPGDTFAMEYTPGKGTLFFIAGQPQGEPVGDDEFFQMVLKIWVGPAPADRLLRDALLGKES